MDLFRRQLILLALLCFVPVSAQARSSFSPMLTDILTKVRKAYNKHEAPVVVFDLDGTLFDNRTRILKILKEYGEEEVSKVRPKLADKIAAIKIEEVEYRVIDTLKKVGITEEAILNNAVVFWAERFFSEKYLGYDVPTPGSVEFVRTLYSTGARIVYLSGRDAPRQLVGTVRSLRESGFPIGIQGSEIILKPTRQTQDAIFKQRTTAYLRGSWESGGGV